VLLVLGGFGLARGRFVGFSRVKHSVFTESDNCYSFISASQAESSSSR
jgi:hypothetical protein